jgi:hypothetical protein
VIGDTETGPFLGVSKHQAANAFPNIDSNIKIDVQQFASRINGYPLDPNHPAWGKAGCLLMRAGGRLKKACFSPRSAAGRALTQNCINSQS